VRERKTQKKKGVASFVLDREEDEEREVEGERNRRW
jgi:hypothetical protein